MITYLLGLPGSGKSYFAVERIFNNFSTDKDAKKDKKVTFKNCYTNINEFKFDKLNNVHRLEFDELYNTLSELHKLYKAKKTDKELVEFLEEKNLVNTLFVIDEAHNHFDMKDIVLVWWLSYHRHLFHEIILITQNLGLIESKYKAFSEFFYVAKPQSLTLFKSHFKYNIFCSSRLSANSKSGNIKVKRQKKVFDLYHSGDSINTSNVILKFLLISLAIFVVLITFVYFFVLKNDLPTQTTTLPDTSKVITKKSHETHNKTAPGVEDIKEDLDYQELKFLTMNCTFNSCDYKEFSIPPQVLRIYIDREDFTLIYKDKKSNRNIDFYLTCSKDFHDFIFPPKKEFKEDEENNNLTIFNNKPTSK